MTSARTQRSHVYMVSLNQGWPPSTWSRTFLFRITTEGNQYSHICTWLILLEPTSTHTPTFCPNSKHRTVPPLEVTPRAPRALDSPWAVNTSSAVFLAYNRVWPTFALPLKSTWNSSLDSPTMNVICRLWYFGEREIETKYTSTVFFLSKNYFLVVMASACIPVFLKLVPWLEGDI